MSPPWIDEEAAGSWRHVALDVGWYRTRFRAVVLDPDWDHLAADLSTTDPDALLSTVESWLAHPPGSQ